MEKELEYFMQRSGILEILQIIRGNGGNTFEVIDRVSDAFKAEFKAGFTA